VNLDKARDEFSQQINSIRNICSQFETEVLGDVMKMGVGADPAFRKHFTHLKVLLKHYLKAFYIENSFFFIRNKQL
jgi:hypothetical protein